MTSGEEAKQRITLTVYHEWEQRAIEEGLAVPLSDKERPSLWTLSKVNAAYSPGGSFARPSWETH